MSVPVHPYATGKGVLSAQTVSSYYNELVFFPISGNYNAIADPSVSGDVNQPSGQPISALITFTPRLPVGQLCYINDFLVTAPYNSEQTINLLGQPTGGTFTLSFLGATTAELAYDITPSELQTALAGLSTIGTGNVLVVADVEPDAYDVEFTGQLGTTPLPAIIGNADELTNLEGAGFCDITVTVTAEGSPQVIEDTAVAIPPLTARIYNGVISTIDYNDTTGFQLVSNFPALNLPGELIYDVTFSSVTFNSSQQVLAPFAFMAPTDTTAICLTDPDLDLLPYQTPITTQWTPGGNLGGAWNGPVSPWRMSARAPRRRR